MDFMRDEFDVAAQAEAGAKMHVCDPRTGAPFFDDDGKPVTITVRGKDCPTLRAVAKAHERKKAQGAKISDERAGLDIFKAAIIDWSGFSGVDGVLECTPENIEMLMSARDWIPEQIIEFMGDRNNFFTG